MKKSIFILLLVVGFAITMSSCSVGMVGAIYTDYTAPTIATANTVGTKVGESSSFDVLGLVSIGDGGIAEAAKNGGITKISHVDTKTTSILHLFTSVKTYVYGE